MASSAPKTTHRREESIDDHGYEAAAEALGAAQALADGRPIDEAIIAGAKSAIPGGPMAQMAFDAAWGFAHGRPVDTAVLGALRERMPGGLAQRAFDTGLALAAAKTAQDRRTALRTAALGALASNLPPVVQRPNPAYFPE